MRQRPTPRVRLAAVAWAWAVTLLVLAACGTAHAASPPGAALRSLRTADPDVDQDMTDQEARRLTECARFHALTPEEVTVFMREGGRRLTCPLANEALPDEYKTKAEKERQAIADAAEKQKLEQWENRKKPTPEQIKAQADADTARTALDQAKAAADDAADKFKKMQEANNAAGGADSAALEQQRKDLVAKQAAAVASQKQYDAAAAALAKADAAKKHDLEQAEADDAARAAIAAGRAEWQKQADADAAARADMVAQLKATDAKRQEDLAQAEADRKQAEQDQHLADDALRKQHEAERKQHEADRQERENKAAAQQKQFSLDEEARLQREKDAKAAAAKSDAEEAEIQQREAARKARDQEIADADAKAKEADAEFQRKKAEQEATKKKYDELEKKRLEDEKARADAEEKAKAAKDQADADALEKEKGVPDEERPKRDDEEDCASSPAGSPPKCENGGRCFQVKGKPEAQRCSCGKGYKGDKCEHKPCPPPAKEGNMVNGKCVKWESQYVCAGCNKIWGIKVTCQEIDTKSSAKTSTRKTNCKGLKEPENELYNRMCKFCVSGGSVQDTKGLFDPSIWAGAAGDGAGDGDGGDDDGGADEADAVNAEVDRAGTARHRQLAPATAAPPAMAPTPARYTFAPSFTVTVQQPTPSLVTVPLEAFVYSVYEHELVPTPSTTLDDLTSQQCIASCYLRMGTVGIPTANMGGRHCTWVLWVPPYQRGNTVYKSKCRIFNAGTFPVEPRPANSNGAPANTPAQPQVLPNHASTAMLAFLTFPRAYDMFRPAGGGVTRTMPVLNSADTFVATMSASTRARQGEGTYVTRGQVNWPNCVVTASTQLEAGQLYQWRIPASLLALQVDYPVLSAATRAVNVNSRIPGGAQWSYTFDSMLRVETVRPFAGSIARGNIGVRADSPDDFQDTFRAIMQVPAGSGTDAGHLVAASQKPPNWFFNYVPQNERSNQGGGCWYNTEEAARNLMNMDCSITYNVKLTYPRAAPAATIDACKSQFRPTKMALDLQIIGGTGACATLAAEWQRRSLVRYTAATNELETTRLMAHTLHRAVYSSTAPNAVHARDLTGLLHFATTSAVVDQCDAETGVIYAFRTLKLTPEFTNAMLLRGAECLASRDLGAHSVLGFHGGTNCKLWTTEETATHDDLTDDAGLCLTMVQVDGIGVVATLTSAATGGCLKFIYEFDPFLPIVANSPPPIAGTISTTTPTAPMSRTVDALLTGLVGTIDMNGDMEECLVWNPTTQGFELTTSRASCLRVQVTQTL